MTVYMFDAAYAPNLASVKAAGGVAVNGYLTGAYASTTTQPAAARHAGLGFVPTYEEGPAELVGASRATGRKVGRKILAAFKAKGLPLDGTVAVYPSVDVNVSAGRATSCNAAWRGMRDVLAGKVSLRAYAEGAIIDALATAGLVDGKCWLAAPTSWPGFDVNDPNICAVQLVGSPVASTDANHLVTDPAALGAWWPAGSPYEVGDMELTDDQLAKIAHAVWAFDNKGRGAGTAWHIMNHAAVEADAARELLAKAGTGVLARVAALQAAVAKIGPAGQVQVAASTVAAAVADRIKATGWKVTAA